ncbi:MAG: hypothetical protein PUB87_01705 [Eubacteriaceae bacterium]|nr:hypothetical protein [Eubacteriaceae bacterium]
MKKFKLLVLAMCLILSLGLLTACGGSGSDGGSDSDTAKAKIILVLEDGTEKPYDIETKEGTSVRDALYEAKLIDDENYGAMFVATIDGNTADAMADGVTWLPCDKDGNELEHELEVDSICFLDFIAVNDGDEIYLKYYTVPTFED